MADMSISGVASGIDWEGMVTKLMEKAKAPAYVMLDKRDKLEGKKSLFEEFRVALQNLQSTLAPLKLASTFKTKQVEVERLDRNSSYKSVLTAKVNADAEINVHDLEVLQLAKGQVNRSKSLSGTLSQNSILSSNTSASYLYVNAGGQKVRVDVLGSDTLESIANKINKQIKSQIPPITATASVLDNKLIIKSDNTGLGSSTKTATLTRSVNGYDTLDFNVDLSAVNGGALVVKGQDRNGSTATFTEGVDFDIVGGNRIRWREYEPQYVPAGGVYQMTYTPVAGETFTCSASRTAGGNLDTNALPFDVTGHDPLSFTIEAGGVTYTAGTDFTVEGENIRWMSGHGPAEGASYDIKYTVTGASETFTLNVENQARDVIASPTQYSDFVTGRTTIRQGNKTYTQGVDFDVVPGTGGTAEIQWKSEAGYDAPAPGSNYDIVLQKTDGTTVPLNATRSATDSIDLTDYGFAGNGGPLAGTLGGISYNGYPLSPGMGGGGDVHTVTWSDPGSAPVARTNVPKYASDYTVEYTCNNNTFSLSDDGNGLLQALELNYTDADHYTAAQDAEIILNGETVKRSSNYIGAEYKNELIKGMTLELKGVGRVSLDVSQDAEVAAKAVQSFVTSYNEVLDWINVRLTEKQLDETKKATLDSDDFRMKWGLLAGNSLLRESKDNLRRLTSKIYTSSFTARSSRQAVYGLMSNNGIVNPGTFSVTVGARTAQITVNPGDTIEDIAARINSPQLNGEPNPLHFDPDGREYPTPFAKAEVKDNKLTVTAGTERPVTLSGNSVLKSLELNYEYTSLTQIGIGNKSTGTISEAALKGTLDFDTSAFMAALENNAEDVSLLVTSFAQETQTYLDNMIKSAQKSVADGVTSAQGAVVREMNAIDTEIKSIDKYLAEFERRLKTKQEGLYAQFAAAEVNLSKMMQQASWLSSVTSQLQQSAAGSQ